MAFSLTTPTSNFLYPATFLKHFEFTDDYERQYVKQLAKQALAEKLRIYMLTDDNRNHLGFIALSVGTISGVPPCIIIDYLFTSLPYRKKSFPELGDLTLSQYLLGVSLQIAQQINRYVPVRYLALQPAHEKLERFYCNLGFTRLNKKEWMFLRI